MSFEAVGISYTDKFSDGSTKLGGVHNFRGPKHIVGTGVCEWDSSFKKVSHNYEVRAKRLNLFPNRKVLVLYGDEILPDMFVDYPISYLAVDFAHQYQNLCPILIRSWAKISNLLFFSIPDELCTLDFPFWSTNVVAHAPKGVFIQYEGKRFITRNEWYNPALTNLIGAGDELSQNILCDTNITRTSVRKAISKTVKFLEEKNARV